mgnify:FL=1
MLFKDIIDLVAITTAKDPDGFPVVTETKRTIFADKKSVRQSEFYQAAAQNIKLELMFDVRSIDYQGEELLEYERQRYKIVRTYDKDGELTELVCSRLEGG